MVYLTRVETFSAAHRLYNSNWDEAKNYEVFGKCSHENWHGHNYELHVTVKGEIDLDTGFVINAKMLSKIIKEQVLFIVDHKNLNIDVPFLKNKFTTVENLAIGIWNILEEKVAEWNASLHCVRIYETPRIFVEYYGENKI